MRIAFVAPFGLRAKGTTRARVLPLARELARRGHTVAVFIPPYDSPEDSGRRWVDESVDAINIVLPGPGRGTAAWHLWLGWRLFRAVRAWQPEVVHIFKPKGPSGLAGMLLWVTRGRGDVETRRDAPGGHRVTVSPVPRVVVDSDDWEGAGGWNDDPRAGYSPLQRRFFAWQERYGLSHADAWTMTSECLRQRALEFGADSERILVLHNGITIHAARSTQHREASQWDAAEARSAVPEAAGPAVRYLRSAILYTRFAGVRAAGVASMWGMVRRRAPDAMLTVVGRGLGGEERELAGIPGIEVQGWVEPAEMPALFARMAVALAPWTDKPSNRARHSAKVLELMAAGLPIVAYAVGELPATLGDAGVLVSPGEVETFAAAVVSLMADPDRAAALGAAAQVRVGAEFTWERLADVAIAAYGAAGAKVGQLADSSRMNS
jgi:glycosyltransferase involved in cell wall biosynthesis